MDYGLLMKCIVVKGFHVPYINFHLAKLPTQGRNYFC